ncbi:MAG: glutamate 5-kinase [Lentisphaerae bacterium]|mgnify:CR=1 FL=1|jgi:glutamate 5-kinase|nr:glutamate 5-kinase [Lentisphaerota bacterium]
MRYSYADSGERSLILRGVKRVVLKIGTRLLMDVPGICARERVAQLVNEIALLRSSGIEVIVVTSGAVGAGMQLLGTKRRPSSVALKQAHAAVGQCELMTLYETASVQHGFHCAQLLLTAADLQDHERHLFVSQCLTALLGTGALPVINENDSVCVDEIKVGDNDTLSAMVSSLVRADLTILLTTIDGMRERDEETGELGARLSVVHELDPELLAMAQGTDGNRFSVGGMITKLRAAEMVTRSGEALLIADGYDFKVLRSIFAGDDVGSLFLPSRKVRMHARQRFLAFFAQPRGDLIVDKGAAKAVLDSGKSLLPGGILGLRGVFERGDAVRILDVEREEIGRGFVNFGNMELSLICGAQTGDLAKLLGHAPDAVEAVHRDNLVVFKSLMQK